MRILKPLVIVAAGLTMTLSGVAYAKGHDQGVADGTSPFEPGERRGLVGLDQSGLHAAIRDKANPQNDFVYGRTLVGPQGDKNRVVPGDRCGGQGFPPGKNKTCPTVGEK